MGARTNRVREIFLPIHWKEQLPRRFYYTTLQFSLAKDNTVQIHYIHKYIHLLLEMLEYQRVARSKAIPAKNLFPFEPQYSIDAKRSLQIVLK